MRLQVSYFSITAILDREIGGEAAGVHLGRARRPMAMDRLRLESLTRDLWRAQRKAAEVKHRQASPNLNPLHAAKLQEASL